MLDLVADCDDADDELFVVDCEEFELRDDEHFDPEIELLDDFVTLSDDAVTLTDEQLDEVLDVDFVNDTDMELDDDGIPSLYPALLLTADCRLKTADCRLITPTDSHSSPFSVVYNSPDHKYDHPLPEHTSTYWHHSLQS